MSGGWSGWVPAMVGIVLGVVVLAVVCAGLVRKAGRTERELARFRSDVRASVTRLRSAAAGGPERGAE